MSFLPLTLGVGRASGAGGGGAPKPPTRSEAEKILKRDDFTCRFCGFRATQFQRLVPVSEGYVTACSFCELVLSLERAGMMGGGVLMWLPEIGQADLNHIARSIYVAQADEEGAPMHEAATRALDVLMTRRSEARKRLGTDDPLLVATLLHENLDDKQRAEAIQKLDGIRLMPLPKHMVNTKTGPVNGFPQMVRFWRSKAGPYGELPPDKWQDVFAKLAA